MNTVLHTADTRGQADHGWLKSRHSFSFANYFDPERMHFGVLRVLNDDYVEGGKGFGMHPHRDMEIVSIPLEGDLEHKDSMGNTAIIRQGDVQVMSAGTGIYHSEYNAHPDQAVKFLQIWVIPRQNGVAPRYDQIHVADAAVPNQLQQVLSPSPDDAGVWVHQDAWFHIGHFDADTALRYDLKKAGNGVYVFVLDGEAEVAGTALGPRDALGASDAAGIDIRARAGARLLVMDVPMS
ncbi:MAG: pirin family protein [Bacteroidota bacterium]